jgi:hypothetical protein
MGKVVSIQPHIEKRIELERVLLVAETFVLYRRAHRCAPRSLDELAEWLTLIAPHHLPIDPYAILSPAEIAMLKSDVKRDRFGPMFRFPPVNRLVKKQKSQVKILSSNQINQRLGVGQDVLVRQR